jgi:hypothetical protein
LRLLLLLLLLLLLISFFAKSWNTSDHAIHRAYCDGYPSERQSASTTESVEW